MGRVYASKKEANYAVKLHLLMRAGLLRDWFPQVRIPVRVNGHLVCTYTCDFVVFPVGGLARFVDVKGYPDRRWPLVKKLLWAALRIDVEEA